MIFSWLSRLFGGDPVPPLRSTLPVRPPSPAAQVNPARGTEAGSSGNSEPKRADLGFPIKLMGVSYYKHIIAGICGDRTPDGGLVKPASCVPDGNGIRVDIEGATVGYVMSGDAWVYAMMIREPVECRALIRGRLTSGHGHPEEFTVRLDLPLSDLPPEIDAHRRCSYDCKVVGEGACQEATGAIIARRVAEKPVPWVPLI